MNKTKELLVGGKVQELNEKNFEEKIEKGVVFIDFFAKWCGPCKMMASVVDEVADTMGDRVFFGKVDIDKEAKLAADYQVTSIPTLVLFKNGREVDRIVGLRDAAALKHFIEKALNE